MKYFKWKIYQYEIYDRLTGWQGSHPTWKTWNFVIYLSRPEKCLEFAQKVGKTWIFNSKPGKKIEF